MTILAPQHRAALFRAWSATATADEIVAAVRRIGASDDACAVIDAGTAFATVLGWTESFDAVALAPEQVRQVLAQASCRHVPSNLISPR